MKSSIVHKSVIAQVGFVGNGGVVGEGTLGEEHMINVFT